MRLSARAIASLTTPVLTLAGLAVLAPTASASVSDKISSFPYTQDWSSLSSTSTWADFPGVEGFTTGTTIAPANQPNTTDVGSLTAEGTLTSALTQKTGTTPNTDSNGGILAYPNAVDKTVALSATGSITTPEMVFHLDTTGQTGIGVAYDIEDLDSSADDQPTRVALQYRVGTSGSYTNVPSAYVDDATVPSNTTVVSTHVSATLPAAVENQPDVFLRVITLDNASGSNEHIGIDNIDITTGAPTGATPVTLAAIPNQTGTVGTPITEVDPVASDGTAPLTWSVDNLPPGLDFNTSTGAITGTPTTSGSYSVTVHVTDSAATPTSASRTFTFAVAAPSGTGGPASPHPVISEVYTDGGYTGASFLDDFVELYNPSTSTVDLSNYSIGYGADKRGTGAYPLPLSSTQLSGSIPPHGHYLIQGHQDAKGIGAALPTPDFTWASAPDFYYAAGLIVLSDQPTPPIPSTGNIANTAHIVDALGYGGDANTFETASQGTDLGATSSASRTVPGTDTDDNHADFSVGSPTPTNTAGEGASGGAGSCDTALPAASSIADVQGTNTDTSPYDGCTVTVSGVVTAAYPTGGFNGFTLQTAGTGGSTDTTPGASDAVFVYGSSAAGAVTVGESVSVTATVQEFAGETELTSPSVTPVTPALAAVTPAQLAWSDLDTDAEREAHESELVAPQGDYTVTDNYDVNYYGTIVLAAGSTKPLFDPTDVATPGSADAQATAAYNAGHTITLDDGSSWNYSTTHTGDPLPWLTATHSVTIGAHTTFGSGGVILDYRNSGWSYQPTHQVTDTGTDVATFTDLRSTVNAAPQPVGGDVRLATFNMENYFVETGQKFVADGLGTCTYYDDRAGNPITDKSCTFADGSAGPRGAATTESFQRQLDKEVYGVNHLGASIVSLEEVENSAKYGEDRDHALSVFVDALNAATAPGTWAYIPTGSLDQPSIDAQDVIRSAFIYKSADVTPVGPASILSNDSGSGQAFSIAREPLAQAFKGVGQDDSKAFLVVSNHFKSKGADANGLFDDCGAGKGDAENTDPAADQGGFNCTRVHEADDMSTWAEGLAQADGIAPIFMLGDFNAYTHEDPLEALYAKGYHDLQTTENGAGAKATYSYGGLEGSLDHVLGNAAAVAMVTGADVWQIDGQEPVAYVYSRYNYNVTQLFSADNPFGISDHDPEIVGLDLSSGAPTPATPTVTGTDVTQTYGQTATMQVTVTATGVTPTGNVALSTGPSGSVSLGSGVLDGTGKATITIPAKAVDASATPYPVTITYGGDGSVAPGSGSAQLTVVKAASTVAGTAVTQTYGKSATMAVRVTAPDVVPTGTVRLKSGATTIGTAELDGTGRAAVTIGGTKLAPGTHKVTVEYSGDSDVAGSSSTATVVVKKGASKVTAKGPKGTIRAGVTRPAVTITVTNPDHVVATGKVTVSGAGIRKVTVTLRNGKATAHLKAFRSAGAKRLTVTYAGSTLLTGSSTHLTLHVVRR